MGEQKTYLGKALILSLIAFLGFGCKYYLNVELAKHLSKEVYGDFSVSLKSFILFSSLILVGTGTSAKRFLAKYIEMNVKDSIRDYIKWNIGLISKTSSFFLSLLLGIFVFILGAHIMNIKQIDTYHMAVYVLFFAPIGAVVSLLASFLQSNKNSYLAQLLMTVLPPVFVGVALFVVVYSQIIMNNFVLTFMIASAFSIIALLEVFLIYKKMPYIFGMFFSKSKKINVETQWNNTAYRLILNQILFNVVVCLDLYILELFGHSEFIVGEYVAICTIAGVIFIIQGAIGAFLVPLVGAYYDKDKTKLQKAVTSSTYSNFFINLLVFLVILYFIEPLLKNFGASYYNPSTKLAFITLGSGYLMAAMSRASTSLIAYSGNEKYLISIAALELVMLTVLGVILTIYFDIIGIAIATCISISAKSLAMMWIAKVKLGYKPLGFF